MSLRSFAVALTLLLAGALTIAAQVSTIVIPAGTPEDQAIQAITNEQDPAKREAMLKDMVQKFASNPDAVAYGYSQLASAALTAGNATEALADGDKALEAMPNNVEILMAQVNAAQAIKDNLKVVQYAAKGGTLFNGIGKQAKPAGMTDDDFAAQNAAMKQSAQPSYEYLETTAYNAIAAETDSKTRMAMIERFTPAFPNSKFEEPVTQLALVSLQDTGDTQKLFAYGDKLLASNPDDFVTLSLLANAYADTKGADTAKALEYARKAIGLANPDDASADNKRKHSAGLAYNALGYALMKEGKTGEAAVELKKGTTLLSDDPQLQAVLLYRLGNAYAMLKRYPEARQVLTQAAEIKGPYQQPSRELLAKMKGR